ncbi:MAG TPA: histidine kinase dimerization/phospho-acceptor domain-containing protein, partial [Bryobacterales bacterium]|nr:histidine kinase dimerization/phospho-acceptor domain-containing protein [Bryobacterales bacterium]
MRVLVLEDNAYDADLTMRALEQAGISVEWQRVETKGAFEEALQSQDWDVIVADFSLPGFDAAGALESARALGLDIPFLVVSGMINEEVAVSLLRAGADDFVIKGRLARLAPAVERAIREKRQVREKHRAEREIQVLAKRWGLLLEHALDGVAVQEPIRDDRGAMTDFRHVEWNQAAERITGVTREQALGRTGRELFPGIDKTGLLARYAKVMDGGASELMEGCCLAPGRGEAVLDIACFRLDEQHFVSLFRDVTGRKRSEERLRQYAAEAALGNRKLEQANAELERANAELARRNIELEEFTHVASHDLQEPLRKVVSFGDLLARELGGKLDAKCSQYLSLIQGSTRRMQALIRDLLVMSRADRAPLRLEPKPLAECVRTALELLSGRIAETGAVVRVDPLPTLTVDAAQISQLYRNLISNAL